MRTLTDREVQYNTAGAELKRCLADVKAAGNRPTKAQDNALAVALTEFDRCESNLDLADQVRNIPRLTPGPFRGGELASGELLHGFNPTEQAFGSREAFRGVTAGFRAAITIPSRRALTIPSGPIIVDTTIPAFADYPRGFADTLIQAPTAGSVTFLRRGVRTNNAAQWASGEKAESSYEWAEATAPLTWIAHHTPISKTEASDWDQLDAIVRNELMIGLAQAKSVAALVGTNAAGIVGVTNTLGTQPYTASTVPDADGNVDNVYDSIRRMATKVFLVSGFRPTHVAMSPQVKEQLDLLKGEDGHYLIISVGTKVWGLEIVEDVGLTTVDDGATHNGAIVYANIGATWYTKETDNVEIGLVDDQFINKVVSGIFCK